MHSIPTNKEHAPMTPKKLLPTGVSTLEMLIDRNLIYVDKTKMVHELITNNIRCFLSRPRRFGKSLLISTLKSIFEGNKKIFEGLWIGREGQYDWTPRPVVHIDFSEVDSASTESLTEGINIILEDTAKRYGTSVKEITSIDAKIAFLIRHMGEVSPNKIAVLIDEYDAPLLRHIDNTPMAIAMRETLKSIYTTIKGLDSYIHFTFVTGVTKFAKTSLFSGPNNLTDISLSEKYATLCGYTEEEITTYFSEYLANCVEAKKSSTAEIMGQIKSWYNGYRMSNIPTTKIYNPYSVLLYFNSKIFNNYWFGSGTPTFLVKRIQESAIDFTTFDHCYADSEILDAFEIGSTNNQGAENKISPKTLLFQTGYLTIESYDEDSGIYQLNYPNKEIRESLNRLMLSRTLAVESTEVTLTQAKLKKALVQKDFALFCSALQALFAHIPTEIQKAQEALYHACLQMAFSLLHLDATSEVSIAGGRIDMVINEGHTVYIFEFKLNQSAKIALNQIKNNRYYEKYLLSNKEIYLIGLNFEHKTKTIAHLVEKL